MERERRIRLVNMLPRGAVVQIAGAGVLMQALALVSGPLSARILGPEGRGTLALLMIVANLACMVLTSSLSLAISDTVARQAAAARDVLRGRFPGFALLAVAAAALGSVAVAIVLRRVDGLGLLVAEGFVVIALACWLNVATGMLQGEGSVRMVNRARILFAATYSAGIALTFATRFLWTPAGVLLSYIVAQLVSLATTWSGLRRALDGPSEGTVRLWPMTRDGWLTSLRPMDGMMVDQLIVGLLASTHDLGLYTVAFTISTLPMMIMNPASAALLPAMAGRSPDRAVATLREWLKTGIRILVALVVALELVLDPMIRILFGGSFIGAVLPARFLVVAIGLLAVRRLLIAALLAQGRARSASMFEMTGAATLCVAVSFGTLQSGVAGAAAAVLLNAAVHCTVLALLIDWSPRTPQDTEPMTLA